MKVTKYFFTALIAASLLISCATKPQNESSESAHINTENSPETIEAPVVEAPAPVKSEAEIFIEGLEGLSIRFTQTPKITNVNRAFNTSYIVEVRQNDVPAADYPITVSYPSSKTLEAVTFTEIKVTTDENGTYTFTPETPSFAVAAKVSVYPTPINDSEEVVTAVQSFAAQADWKVRSNILSKGAVLFIWDYNEKNRPVNNSYNILSECKDRGIYMVGNAPVNETSYIGKPLSTLYKENYEIIEDSYGYLIVGSVKFTKPVEPAESGEGYLCSLVAEIQAVNMKNGAKVFSSTFTQEAVGKNWNACVTKCKDELSKQVVDALIYGL